jgi:RND family efflux transporter MFP subunit
MNARTTAWIIAGVVAVAMAPAGCSPDKSEAEPAKVQVVEPVEVEVYRVKQRQLAGVLRASGLVTYKNETPLSFGAPGVIETISVDSGSRVQAGQVLATLRRTTVGADAAEGEIIRQTAQQTYDRVSRLFAAGAASQADLDNARLGLERAREIVSIVAPASGVVLRRDADRGQTLQAGQAVVTLGEDRAGMIVRAALSSVDVAQVHAGDTANVAIQGREPQSGKVARISPKMAAGMGSFEVEVQLDNPKDLKSGEVAEVRINAKPLAATEPVNGSFVIPAIALIDARADQGMVYVLNANNVAVRRAVRTEGLVDTGVVVTGGLQPGDAVITRGASMVRDGDTVKVANPQG